jgi:hypothetical protein
MIGHLAVALESKLLAGGGASFTKFFDDLSFCRPRKNSKSITASLLAPSMLD